MTERILHLGQYRHYKSGDLYEVISTAIHSETLEELVIYKALYHSEKYGTDRIWARPKEMFLEDIEYNGVIIPRFQLVKSVDL